MQIYFCYSDFFLIFVMEIKLKTMYDRRYSYPLYYGDYISPKKKMAEQKKQIAVGIRKDYFKYSIR